MSVRPYKNKKGEIVLNAFEINCYPHGRAGKQVKKVVHDTTQSKAELIELALIRNTIHSPPPHDPTVNECWHEWLKEYARDAEDSTITDVTYASIRLLPYFGDWHLSRLTLPLFTGYMDKRRADLWRPPIKNPDPAKTYAPGKPTGKSRINTELKYFGMFIQYCLKKKYMLPLPFQIPKYKKLPKRVTNLPRATEIVKLLSKCHDDARLAVLLYNDAGLRKDEGLTLTVEKCFLDDDIITVIGKGDKERHVVITSERLKDELRARIEKVKTGLLMKNTRTGEAYKNLRKSIEMAAERAGIKKNIYNHLFRHSHITALHDSGVPVGDIQEQAGHASIKTTMGYIHSGTERRVKAIKAASYDRRLKNEKAK
jgi:integrase